DDPTASACNIQ
nr:Chain C, peptide derived from the C-terminus of Rap2a [synthetic construct]3Q78_D Chain D, peptide substrate [synthetic construct]3Q79_P Chain P, isoprenylated product [synthetic construct]